MAYVKRKLPLKNAYQVKNVATGMVHSRKTTKRKAESQIRLLNAIDHGFKPKGGCCCGGSFGTIQYTPDFPNRVLPNATNPLIPQPLQLRFL